MREPVVHNNTDDRLAVVTGASGGIGQWLCRGLADRGFRLALFDLASGPLEAMAEEFRRKGTTTTCHTPDIRIRSAVHDAFAAVERDSGPVDLLIHSAGVFDITRAHAPAPKPVEDMLEVNYLGAVYAIEGVLPSMLKRGSGHLVAISSLAALRGLPFMAGYCASKAALSTFMESLRPSLRKRGVAVTTCHPGLVLSRMVTRIPFRYAVMALSSPSAAEIILRAVARRRKEIFFPWFSAWHIRSMRQWPHWLYDLVMGKLGCSTLIGEEY